MVGDRGRALDTLTEVALSDSAESPLASKLLLQAVEMSRGHGWLQQISPLHERRRCVIEGSGIVGDPKYVPWLLARMTEPDTARIAAEAFMTITGLDLFQGFEVQRPEGFESGPTDDPADENVGMHPDEGLPWPDVPKVQAWWDANSHRFEPGTRYFMGAPVTRAHCIDVLKNGYQRQRILAAHYLCLLEPGTPLFNTSAPAWRQQKLLAQMS
jgi:uncharacterized protein (TIGR02270 family)